MRRMLSIITAISIATAAVIGARTANAICSFAPSDTDDTDIFIFQTQGGLAPGGDQVSIWYAPKWTNTDINYAQEVEQTWGLAMDNWGASGGNASPNGAPAFDPYSPFNKILNSSYLLTFGLGADDPTREWHTHDDYFPLVVHSDDLLFHHQFTRVLNDTTSFLGEWDWRPFGVDDQVQNSCELYDVSKGGFYATPASRLATNIHESWHAWENKNFRMFAVQHQGAHGNCDRAGSCDPFYPHTLNTFQPGRLFEENFDKSINWLPSQYTANVPTPNKFHSPNQIAFEMMCDLITNHAEWVSEQILSGAQMRAMDMLQHVFINMPPMDCADHEPLMR